MELIIKPTELCNFKCTFCSSTNIADSKQQVLNLEYVEQFITRFPNTNTIIVNGGDPLMVPPKYYYELIEMLESKGSNAIISLTTNLWDFKLKPEKWVELFNHPRIEIATSFNYGGTRRISATREYTEEDFWEVSNMMLELVGYRPSFISVVDNFNYDSAIDNVLLAQKMGVEVKLNRAMMSGIQSDFIPLSKMYELYLKVIEAGLGEFEHNTKEMVRSLNSTHTICPLARNCDKHIRTLHPDGKYYPCGSFADDGKYAIDFEEEVIKGTGVQTPISADMELTTMKVDCWACPMFSLCNGCRKTIEDTKRSDMVEVHCAQMHKNMDDLLRVSGENASFIKSDLSM